MNDHYNTYIEHRGRVYRYDPDYDCFYPVDRWHNMSTWERWSPLIVIVMLAIAALCIEYRPGLV